MTNKKEMDKEMEDYPDPSSVFLTRLEEHGDVAPHLPHLHLPPVP